MVKVLLTIIIVGICYSGVWGQVCKLGYEMLPTTPVSLAYAEVNNKKLSDFINDRLINQLLYYGNISNDMLIIEILSSSKEFDRLRLIICKTDFTRFFPKDIEFGEYSSDKISIIPNDMLEIYVYIKPNHCIKNTGKHSGPKQWQEICFVPPTDERAIECIVDVYRDYLKLVDIESFQGYKDFPESIFRTLFTPSQVLKLIVGEKYPRPILINYKTHEKMKEEMSTEYKVL